MESFSPPANDVESPFSEAHESRWKLISIVASVMLGMLLSSLDQTIVGTAMPRVIADLNGLEHYAWVFTAYMLASTVSVPIYGKLSDIYGRRPFYVLGMAIFLVGSALSGMAQTMPQLILFRGIQGLGAGAMMPIAMAIIGDVFPPSERGKWQGLLMSVFGLTTIVGPTLGGWLTDNWGWRWVFYVNMPVGAIAIIVAALALPRQVSKRAHTIDYYGAAALVAGTVPLLLGFSWAGTEYAWTSPQIIGLLAFAVIMLTAFVFIETKAAEPIISPHLFRNQIFTVSSLATFLTAAGMFGATLYLPLFIQGVLGKSATSSGAVLTPMMLGFIVSSIVAGQIMSRTGHYKMLALGGFIVGTIGMVLLAIMPADVTSGVVVRNMIILGLGIGVSMSLFTIIVQNAFPFRQLGEVTASLTFFRSIGGTIGAALFGTVMTNRFHASFNASLSPEVRAVIPEDQLSQLGNPQVLISEQTTTNLRQLFDSVGANGNDLFNQFMLTVRDSLSASIGDLFMVGAVAMAVALVSVIFLKEIPLRSSFSEDVVATTGEAVAGASPEMPSSLAGGQNTPINRDSDPLVQRPVPGARD